MGIFSKFFNGAKKPEAAKTEATTKAPVESQSGDHKEITIYSPVNGRIKYLANVSDPVFSEEMTGKGIAIVPNSDETVVFSPLAGKVKVAFPTGHAYGIATGMGPEILVHIGIDTVELDGKGFVKKVEVDEDITISTELCDIDIKTIRDNDKEDDVIVIATNDSIVGYDVKIDIKDGSEVKVGDPIFKIIKKA